MKRRIFGRVHRKAVLYARYSPRPGGKITQDPESMRTITSQWDYARAYCDQPGNNWEVVGKYRDDEESGTSMKGRKGLDDAIAKTKAVRGVLVVYSLNRMTRCTKDALEILDDLHVHGCDVAVLDFMIDTTTPHGKLFFTMAAAVAELQAGAGAKATSDAIRHYTKTGYVMSSKCPYGWKPGTEVHEVKDQTGRVSKRRIMVPDEEEQVTLDIMMSCKAKGWSIGKIIAHLKLIGRKNRNGRTFDPKSVWNIINRELSGGNPARTTANPAFVRENVGALKDQGLERVDEQ